MYDPEEWIDFDNRTKDVEFNNKMKNIIYQNIYFSRLAANGLIDIERMSLCKCFNLSAYFRTYVRDIINASEIMSGGVKNAYYHYAAFHGYNYGSWVDYLASCFTYFPQHRVPPGEQHKVLSSRYIKKWTLTKMLP